MSSSATEDASSAAEVLIRRHQEGVELINAFSATLQRLSVANGVLGEEEERLRAYITKLETAQASMVKIMNRTQAMQLRLSTIREVYDAQSKALVQPGPFLYKCVHQGGVRYRDYPKGDATILPAIIKVGEIVQVEERVYMSGEALVYLHVKGVGWLFENKDGVVALKRIPKK